MEKFAFPDYDPEAQLVAISEIVRNLDKLLEEKEKMFNESNYGDLNPDYAGEIYAGDLQELFFLETAISHSAIAVIAPFLEGLFRHEIAALRENGYKSKSTHPRANDKRFWKIELALDENGKMNRNLPGGIYQVLQAIGLLSLFPPNFQPMLDLIFSYRNFTLHNGFEAKIEEREKFKQKIQEIRMEQCFSWSTSGGKPWLVAMKRNCIGDCFKFCLAVKEGFDKQKDNG